MKNKITLLAIILATLAFNSCKKKEDPAPAVINLSTADESAFEISSGKHIVTVSMDRALASDVTINLAYAGTAVKDQDYLLVENNVIIPAGKTTAEFTFATMDNKSYEGTDRTIEISLTSVSSSEAKLGSNTSYTYTIQEDDLQIELTWNSSTDNVDDFDLDLYLYKEVEIDKSLLGSGVETIVLNGSLANGTYFVVVDLANQSVPNSASGYAVELSFPDGSTQKSTDFFDDNRNWNRTLFSISKEGASYSATENPNGANSRIANN